MRIPGADGQYCEMTTLDLRERKDRRAVTRTVIYSMGVSLDGFTAGPDGDIGWAAPDAELMAFHNEQTRKIDAVFCGRGLYEDMLPWENAEQIWTDPAALEFARICPPHRGRAPAGSPSGEA